MCKSLLRKFRLNCPPEWNLVEPSIEYQVRSEIVRPAVPRRSCVQRLQNRRSPIPRPSSSRQVETVNSIRPPPREWARRQEVRKRTSFQRRRAAYQRDSSLRFREVAEAITPPLPVVPEFEFPETSSNSPSPPYSPSSPKRQSDQEFELIGPVLQLQASSDSEFELV